MKNWYKNSKIFNEHRKYVNNGKIFCKQKYGEPFDITFCLQEYAKEWGLPKNYFLLKSSSNVQSFIKEIKKFFVDKPCPKCKKKTLKVEEISPCPIGNPKKYTAILYCDNGDEKSFNCDFYLFSKNGLIDIKNSLLRKSVYDVFNIEDK